MYQYTILSLYRYLSIDIRYNVSCQQHAIPQFDTLQSSKFMKTFQNVTKSSHVLAGKYVSVTIIHAYKNGMKHSKRFNFFIFRCLYIFHWLCMLQENITWFVSFSKYIVIDTSCISVKCIVSFIPYETQV